MSTSIFNKYPEGHTFEGRRVLNAGCGFAIYRSPNIVNLDAYDNCEPDVVWNLDKTPLPFADNTFDLIIANHIMEHLADFWSCFEEFARICKPGGVIEIYVPGSGSDSVFGFRDHVREINANSFYGVHGTHRGCGNAWSVAHADTPANRLHLYGTKTFLENYWWLNRWPLRGLRAWATKHLRNIVVEKGYIFRKMNDGEWANEQRKHGTDPTNSVLLLRKAAISK